jgi:mycothiol system anti-sigma-R factor
MYDCEDCIQRLDQLVDKELNGLEVEEIAHHLDTCGDCTRRYRFQEGLKRLVKVSCSDQVAPVALRESLRRQLASGTP